MDSSPQSYQQYLDELTAFGTTEARKDELLAAKRDYIERTGEVFEDDKSFEMRMASFLDYYLFDRISPVTHRTPAQELYQQKVSAVTEAATHFRGFTETVHGLFEVRKLGKGVVRLRELYSGKDFEVTERRQLAGLERGDILEARLIPHDGHLWFSSAFIYHPRDASKPILKELKRRKKKEPQRTAKELAWDCAKRALKADRYRQIAVEKIYDFEQTKI